MGQKKRFNNITKYLVKQNPNFTDKINYHTEKAPEDHEEAIELEFAAPKRRQIQHQNHSQTHTIHAPKFLILNIQNKKNSKAKGKSKAYT